VPFALQNPIPKSTLKEFHGKRKENQKNSSITRTRAGQIASLWAQLHTPLTTPPMKPQSSTDNGRIPIFSNPIGNECL
jgi:hypothetical protein